MINLLLCNLQAIILQPAYSAATSEQKSYYLYGAVLTITVVIALSNYLIFKPLEKKLTKKNGSANVAAPYVYTLAIKNETDYADYITWTAKNGYIPHFEKTIISDNL